jgi:hypothetical protein
MTATGCIITIGSLTAEATELPAGFVQVRLAALILTEEPSVNVLLKVVGEGDGGPVTDEHVLAGTVNREAPAVWTEVALDAYIFSTVHRWRVTGIVCYSAGAGHSRCSCTPSDIFTSSCNPAPAS